MTSIAQRHQLHGRRACALVVGVALLAGCASPVYRDRYAWNEGWREGVVLAAGRGADLGERRWFDCRYALPAAQAASSRFVVVQVSDASHLRHVVVPLAAGALPARGDRLVVRARSCEPPP